MQIVVVEYPNLAGRNLNMQRLLYSPCGHPLWSSVEWRRPLFGFYLALVHPSNSQVLSATPSPFRRVFEIEILCFVKVIKGLRKHTKALLDAHLMVTHPAQWVDDMAAAGVDRWGEVVCGAFV